MSDHLMLLIERRFVCASNEERNLTDIDAVLTWLET
jgi:hypothetical protein